MLKNVRTISVWVSDQDRSVDFYVNTLGFEKIMDVPMGPDSRWIEVRPGGGETTIVLGKDDGSGKLGSFTGFIYGTDDINATYESLSGRGVNFPVPPSSEQWGWWAQFADPDGNQFGIWAPPESAS
jgi:lactoylglutathione lyase